jgi:hypothetical protein
VKDVTVVSQLYPKEIIHGAVFEIQTSYSMDLENSIVAKLEPSVRGPRRLYTLLSHPVFKVYLLFVGPPAKEPPSSADLYESNRNVATLIAKGVKLHAIDVRREPRSTLTAFFGRDRVFRIGAYEGDVVC